MRVAALFRKCAALAVALLLCAGVLTLRAAAQQNANDRDSAESFVDSMAQTVYKVAWPTATYRRISDIGFEPADDGFNVVVTLSGISAFGGGELWLKLAFVFRNGGLADVQVRGHNAWLMPPFATSRALANVAAQLATDYAKDQNQPQNQAQIPTQTQNPPVQGSTVTALPPMPVPDAAPQPTPPDTPATPQTPYAADIRSYLSAAEGGFPAMIAGDPSVASNGMRQWTLRPPAGSSLNCSALQGTLPFVDCPLYESDKNGVNSMAGGLLAALQNSLPPGWTMVDEPSGSDPMNRVVTFFGPGRAQALIKLAPSTAPDQDWLVFQIVFP